MSKARMIPYHPPEQRGEKVIFDFLKDLPSDYTVYSELKVSNAYEDRAKGWEKKQPDFVVIGEPTGVIIIEVKDWDLDRNTYSWRNQSKVVKKNHATGVEEELTNPAAQADDYLHAMLELLRSTGVMVTSLVAFPRLSRTQFLNKVANLQTLQNTQTRFFLNLDQTLFKEDLDQYFLNPDQLLVSIAKGSRHYRATNADQVERVHQILMPSKFRVGDTSERQKQHQKLSSLTREQEKWIRGLDRSATYLLDVAGSGKTNALISKALHLLDTAHKNHQPAPNILLTTYNPNLQRSIEHILQRKINEEDRQTRYRTLRVENVEYIMERIAITGYECTAEEYRSLNPLKSATYQQKLRDDVRATLSSQIAKYRVFDYVFIDEIQDFDDDQLDLVIQLCRGKNFFFVGDIGQKIYDRYHDLRRHGFVMGELELDKTYRMYRTPRGVGELAYQFITADPVIRDEFAQRGYKGDIKFASVFPNAAEILRAEDQTAVVVERLQTLSQKMHPYEDMMVITSKERLPVMAQAFKQAQIPYVRQTGTGAKGVLLTDFMNVKGLEAAQVFITGIEQLYHREQREALFSDAAAQMAEERFSRRKIYVALTRTIEDCCIYYTQPANKFIQELLTINRGIDARRQKGQLTR